MPSNLIAYIPVLNQRHLDWFEKHPESDLLLISQNLAESFLPRLSRNMSALPTKMMVKIINSLGVVKSVGIFWPNWNDPARESSVWDGCVVADEDVSRFVAEKYLTSLGINCEFENIWARWDMSAVHQKQPVIPDFVRSSKDIDILRLGRAQELAKRSPDWWRQIGAMAFRGDMLLACGWNGHFPAEYETDIFGDPRINFDAGDPAGREIYLSLHAEKMMVARAARQGFSLNGASVYVTTFPCGDCARFLAVCGIKELFFFDGYSILKGAETLQNAGVKIIQVVKDPKSP